MPTKQYFQFLYFVFINILLHFHLGLCIMKEKSEVYLTFQFNRAHVYVPIMCCVFD